MTNRMKKYRKTLKERGAKNVAIVAEPDDVKRIERIMREQDLTQVGAIRWALKVATGGLAFD